MTKSTIWFVVVCICFSAGYVSAQDVVTVRVAEFPPNYFKDDAGNWTGFSVKLAEAIITAAGFEPKFVELPWSRAMEYVKEGDLQYMTGLLRTEERSEFLHWIGPVRTGVMGLIVHRDHASLPITTLDDLVTVCHEYKKQFGIQKDISYSDAFAQRINDDPEFQNCFETVVNVDFNLRKTVNQRILGFFESVPTMRYRIHTDPEFADLTVHPFVVRTDDVFHGLSKQGISPEMLKRLQDGYTQCMEDGTIQRIVEQWHAQ